MARIRTIKPEFFTSDDICALSPHARLIYIGLWCEADREGRLMWAPKTFKRRYLPDDKCDADAVCGELVTRGLVRLYGEGLAYIPTFLDHQKPNPRESVSTLPAPDHHDANLDLHASNPELHAQGGREGEGREGEGREGEGREDASREVADASDGEVDAAYAEFVTAADRHNWPKPRQLDTDRRRKLRTRLEEHGLDGWLKALEMAGASEFLTAKWPLKLDWLLEPKNFRKVVEGNYRNPVPEAPARRVADWN
jgi:hypothetical protein